MPIHPQADVDRARPVAGTHRPTVSWLLPVKNGMPYLKETLASIAAQTFTDFEVLAWLVKGHDGSREELDRWIPAVLPGRVVETGPLGIGPTLNELVAASTAELCARIDSDDTCEPDRLAKQVAFLRSHPEVALVGTNLRLVDSDGRPTGELHASPVDHAEIVHTMLLTNVMGHPSVLFRRDAVIGVGNYANAKVEDFDLWLRLACTHRLATIPEYLVNYRVHAQSKTKLETAPVVSAMALETLAAHSLALYGLKPLEIARLHAKEHKFVAWPAAKVAWHLSRQGNPGFWKRLGSPALIDVFRYFRRPYDLVSLILLALIDRRKCALPGCLSFIRSLFLNGLKRRLMRQHPTADE